MRPSIHRLRHRLALTLGLYVNTRTTPKEIINLARALHPVATDKDLIRLGPIGDGGYVVPDDFEGIEALISPGVGPESGFDEAVAELGIPVFMADGSVEAASVLHPLFEFRHCHVGDFDRPGVVTLDTWVNEVVLSNTSDLMLQMDIEAGEYKVIPTISDHLLKRFRMIVVEFHRLHQLWDPFFFSVASGVFGKILQHHYCVHAHPNNNGGVYKSDGIEIPKAMEFTFLRKDRATVLGSAKKFPHALDADNVTKPSVVLPKMWFADSDPTE